MGSASPANRCGCNKVTQQEVVPHGVLHSSQEQHEGDAGLLYTHLIAVPLLCKAAPNVAVLPRPV